MTDFHSMTDEQLNEWIFKSKGWQELPYPATPRWQRPGEKLDLWFSPFPPDYCNSWQWAGELLGEMQNASLKRYGDKWVCGSYDDNGYLVTTAFTDVFVKPTRAISEAYAVMTEKDSEG